MKNVMLILSLGILAACASKPAADGSYDTAKFEGIVSNRAPAASEDETYGAYKIFIFESTKWRLEGLRNGDVAKICNATNAARGWDTFAYYISFEALRNESAITARLRKEYGPFFYRNFVSMDEQKLPYKLHDACTSKNRGKIMAAMQAIQEVYNLE